MLSADLIDANLWEAENTIQQTILSCFDAVKASHL